MNADEEKEFLIRTCVFLTEKMIDGAWKGRVSESELESLIAVIAGRGTTKDYSCIKDFGVEI